jgi:uncharacterized protein (DUF58 family)
MDEIVRKWLIEGKELGSQYVPSEPRHAPHGTTGSRLGRRPGESLEFEDYRDYQPGDDLRKLDWNVYARSDALVVRVYREEVVPHLDIILDGSASMAVRPAKHAATIRTLGLLAGAAGAAGFATRVWQIGQVCREVEGSGSDVSNWRLDPIDGKGDSGEIFVSDAPRLQPRGIRVFISDLLFTADPEIVTTMLARQASGASIIQLMDEDDRTPPEHGTIKLIDSETNAQYEAYIDDASRRRYLKRLEEHLRQWEMACQRRGIAFAMPSAQDLLDGNLDDLVSRGVLRAP